MPCTTILAGKAATCDGSTLMARNEDASSGKFDPKRLTVVRPEDQPKRYVTVHSGLEIELPDGPLRYTAMPNALSDEGIWAAAGVNECNVAMTATETITSNPRVLGADPMVENGGIGEEDLVTITLPYIRSAREGVLRLGALHEKYGTYEKNGVGFQDVDELWWFETVGGHHWIARRVPDDRYIVAANRQSIDYLDLTDAFGEQKETLCSADLLQFIEKNHLDRTMRAHGETLAQDRAFDARAAFGSRSDADRIYNNPRVWSIQRRFSPDYCRWDGPDADFGPESFDLPWCLAPDRKLTVGDLKRALSDHYQGTPYDPYGQHGDASLRGLYRPVGVNRNNVMVLTQLRPYAPADAMALEWVAFGSNVFNEMVPLYANVESAPEYFSRTDADVTTESFYWANRLIGALADAHYSSCVQAIEEYCDAVAADSRELLREFESGDGTASRESFNHLVCVLAKKKTDALLNRILYLASLEMKNGFSRSDG